jgi:hypothetical protein
MCHCTQDFLIGPVTDTGFLIRSNIPSIYYTGEADLIRECKTATSFSPWDHRAGKLAEIPFAVTVYTIRHIICEIFSPCQDLFKRIVCRTPACFCV